MARRFNKYVLWYLAFAFLNFSKTDAIEYYPSNIYPIRNELGIKFNPRISPHSTKSARPIMEMDDEKYDKKFVKPSNLFYKSTNNFSSFKLTQSLCDCLNRPNYIEANEVLFRALSFVKEKNVMDYSSLTIVINVRRCHEEVYGENIIRFLLSKERIIPCLIVKVRSGDSYSKLSYDLNASLEKDRKSLIIVDDCFESDILDKLMNSILKSTLNKHYLMFLIRDQNNLDFQKYIANLLIGKIDISSHVYILSARANVGYLSEVYSKCPTMQPTISHIATIGDPKYESNHIDFIWNRRKNLEGCQFKVAYVHDPPFVFEHNSTQASVTSSDCLNRGRMTICGSYVYLFKTLAEELNFNIEWVKALDNKYGSFDEENGIWNGVTGLLSRNEADLSILHISVTASRNKVIQYSVPISETPAKMYIKKPTFRASWNVYLEVFDSVVWGFLLLMAVIVSLFGTLFFINLRKKLDAAKYISHFTRVFLYFWATIGLQDVNFADKVSNRSIKSTRIFMFFISLFGITIYSHYQGNLISYVTLREPVVHIENLEGVLKQPGFQLIVQSGSAEEDYFKLATDWPNNEIWTRTMEDNKDAFVTSSEMNNVLLNDENKVLFGTAYYSEMYLPDYPCNIQRLGISYLQGSTNALGFSPESAYRNLFSHMLIKIKNTGAWDAIQKRMGDRRPTAACLTNEKDNLIGVDYKSTFSLFIVLFVGILFAIASLFFETISHKNTCE